MAYIIGIVLALGVFAFARWTHFDRDRAFYPTVVIVVAQYYVLFATMRVAQHALAVAGLAGHGLFDMVHGRFVANPGVPEWWPMFCLTFDVGLAALVAFRIEKGDRLIFEARK